MSTKQKKQIVALGISKLPVPQLIANTRHYVTEMTGNSNFPNPNPTLASVTAQVNLVETDYDISLTRVKGSVSKMKAEVRSLMILLKALAAYVEGIANANSDHAADIIASAGMPLKKPAVHPPKTFSVKQGTLSGTVVLNTKGVRSSAYIYQMTTDPTNAASWATIYIGTRVKFIKDGLTHATHYSFRVAVSTKGVQGDWSNVLTLLVS
jgi:hypothetical protein